MSGSKCYKCNRMGHFARECPMGSGPGPRGRGGPREKCYKCNRPGHFARDCKEEEDHCYRCDGVGHIAKDCEHSSDEPSCYNCSKMGHIARDCPEPERTCYVCNKSGHISRQCTENKSENRNAKCYVCGKIGHISRECPLGGEQENEKRCYVCGAGGHISRDCPQGESDTTCYRSPGRSPFLFGSDMCRKDMPFGPNLQSEMQQLKRQLDFVNQKYENEKLKRELLEKEKALEMERAAMLSSQGGNYNSGMDGLQGMQGRHQMDRFSEIRSENSRMPGDHYSQESHPQSMLNSGCQQSYGLDHYQQGLKRDAMTRQDNWDLKRQRY
ncbi:uncharacterized protein LOC135111173 isoform X1 [Scylla paramamosain]|uniref:CCHC-type domain-containing protein n=1 Tax=Scylla olivacea TaxID=85551 RepID=A0A0P4WHY6_SCYOL